MPRPLNLQVRADIVQTAFFLFASRGYKAVSMEDIAEVANIRKANLFHYYPSKETLALSVLDHARKFLEKRLETELAVDQGDPIDTICRIFDYRADAKSDGYTASFIGNVTTEMATSGEVLRVRVAEQLEYWTDHLAQFVEAWKGRGYFQKDLNSLEVAMSIVSLCQGAIMVSSALGSPVPLESATDFARQYLTSKRTLEHSKI